MKKQKGKIIGCIAVMLLATWLIVSLWLPSEEFSKTKESGGIVRASETAVKNADSINNTAKADEIVSNEKGVEASTLESTGAGRGRDNRHFQLLSTTPERTRFRFTLGDYKIDEEVVEGITYSVPVVSDGWHGNIRGKPQLPIFRTRLAVSAFRKSAVKVLDAEWAEVACAPPKPAVGHFKRNEAPGPAEPDIEIYGRDGVWPEESVALGQPSMLRNTCLAGVSVMPMRYDFGRGVMLVCRSCEIEVTCDGASADDYATLSVNGDFRRLQADGVLNRSLLKARRGSEAVNCIGRILFVVPDAWIEPLADYSEWKECLGYEVQVKGFPTDTEEGADGIASTVSDAYSTWGMTHLVLIGRVEELPSAIMAPTADQRDRPTLYSGGEISQLAVSDVPYVLLSGQDDVQDAFLSRIPVRNQAELATVLGKLKAYEEVTYSEDTDDSWRQRSVFIGSNTSSEEYYLRRDVPPELRGRDDADVAESERQRLIAQAGFAVDSFGFYRSNANAALIQAGLQVGSSLCNYIGHGLNDVWSTGEYDVTKAKKLTNGSALPFVCSFACLTGNFGCTKEATSWVYNSMHQTDDGDCLAEGFLKNASGGACGVLAATNEVSIIPPYYMMMKLDDDVIAADTSERLTTLGAYSLSSILAGVDYSETTTYECSDLGDEIARQFELVGDCSLAGRFRRLQPMTVAIKRVADGIAVTAVRGTGESESPADGAFVCGVMSSTGTRRRVLTDDAGHAVLSFTAEEQAEPLAISIYDPLSGLVEKVILPIDADGDGAVSDTEILSFLAETSDNAQRLQAIAQWQASGVASPQTAARRSGTVKAVERPEPPSTEANDRPFDCRSNPHGRDASVSEPTRSGVRAASYCTYDELMNRLENCWMNHWDVCRPVFIGESVQGRRIMGVRIGRVNDDDGAAELLIAGGIHGNERPGVEVALRFAEWLLDKRSGTDANSSRVRALIESTALFVIPSMNPDGMVAASVASANTTAWNNARENANGIDLNRSYPDGVINAGLGLYGEGAGLCLDESLTFAQSGMQWHASLVPETVAFMKWCCSRRLAAAIMLHTGAATVCYPYGNNETGRAVESVCPDDALLKYLAKGYVAHSTLTGMTTINSAAWYPVVGEAPDWMYRYLGVLSLTVEISTTKEPSATRLDTVFAQQWPALLWWMEAASHGVGGRVQDAAGEPIAWARVSSNDEAPAFTGSNGRFFRTVKGDGKSITIRAAGFEERSVDLASNHRVELELQPLANAIRMAGRVSRGRFLPNYLENVSIAVQGCNDGAQECIIRLEAEAAQMATIGGTSEYWRWNADGSASVLFEQGVATVQNFIMTLTQFDRPYSDHRLRLGCRTVSEVTQMVFPWVSATRRTFVVNMPAKAAFALPAFLEQPSITQGCFRWSGGRFSEAADGVLPLEGYWNSGKKRLPWTENGWEPAEWRWELAQGWNFVAVPWRMPAKVFGPVMLHGSPALTLVKELVPGRAYWVYSSQETIIR